VFFATASAVGVAATACGPKAIDPQGAGGAPYEKETYDTPPTTPTAAAPPPADTTPAGSIPAGDGWSCFATNVLEKASNDSMRASFCKRTATGCGSSRDVWRKTMSANAKIKVTTTSCVHSATASCFIGVDGDGDASYVCSATAADCSFVRTSFFDKWTSKAECQDVN